ncbi:MAG: oligosaccharide flippase family protein [Ignisphaera sp.]|uniref:Polysaccharide biosynthesis protein n=1 Tax=Ignisphaera aggregans TaxID=334771 RepID=A0A7C4NLV5_9CREN
MDSDVEELGIAARSAIILSLGDFIYSAVLALSYVIVIRFLGSEGYGLYSLVHSVPLLLYSFVSLSVDMAISRYIKFYISRNMVYEARNVVKVSLYIKILTGLSTTIICLIFPKPLAEIVINRPDAYNYIMLASTIGLLNSLYTYLLSVFVGLEEAWVNSIIKITYSISRTVTVIPLLLIGFYVVGAIASHIVSLFLAVAIGIIPLISIVKRKLNVNLNKRVDDLSLIAKELISYSIPLHTSSLIATAVSMYQTVLLARTLTDTEIGGYRALTVFQTFITVILGPITIALLPMFTGINAKGGKEALLRALTRSNKYISFIVVPLTLLTMVFSRELVYLICGPDYLFAYVYLPLLFAPYLLVGFGSATIPQLFNAIGETKLNLYVSTISSAIFVPTSYILTMVLDYRLWGFLASSLISSISSVTLYNVLLVKILKDKVNVKALNPLYASSLLALSIPALFLYIPLPKPISLVRVVVGGVLYILLYIAFSVVLKALNEQDIEFFEKAFQTIPVLKTFIKLFAIFAKKLMKIVNASSNRDKLI